MVDTGEQDNVESFRVPRAWENDAPRCVTHSVEGLIDFLDQVDDVIALAQIVDSQERKQILTSYLPVELRMAWRSLAAYSAEHSYAEFRHAIRGLYPEIVTHERGSLSALDKLCGESRVIGVEEEGRLRRFGLEFCALVAKTPAVITNRDACQKYLNVLDPAFSRRLCQAVIDRKLVRVLARQAGILPVAPEVEPHVRREDPIPLQELVEIAEELASMDVGPDATLSRGMTNGFQEVGQLENMRGRVEGYRSELHAELQDALGEIDMLRMEVHALQRHTQRNEVKGWRETPVIPSIWPMSRRRPDPLAQYASVLATAGGLLQQHNWANDLHVQRLECHYCNQRGHVANGCPTRMQHLANGWILAQDSRKIKLFDGRTVPRGRGSPARKVTKLCRDADFDTEHSNVSIAKDSEDQVATLLSEVCAMQKEVEEMMRCKDQQDSLLLNYWRSEWDRRSGMTRTRGFEGEQCKGGTEDVTVLESENVLDTCGSSEGAQTFELRAARLAFGPKVARLNRNGLGQRPHGYWRIVWIWFLVLGRRLVVEESCGYFVGFVLEHQTGGFKGRSAGLHKITYGDPSPEHTQSDGVLWRFG
ncbi:hypothetical protein B0H11DRAFT_2205110 [Mycena galericulata]|nr:hypothetical protein B0H11DRAFT_2205110 [Mycena galericulata]